MPTWPTCTVCRCSSGTEATSSGAVSPSKAISLSGTPDALIDSVSLCGPPDVVRERLAIYRDAGVGTLGVTPIAFTAGERLEQLRLVAELAAA